MNDKLVSKVRKRKQCNIRTRGEEIPLNNPINSSSRTIVKSPFMVEEYCCSKRGFWKRTFTASIPNSTFLLYVTNYEFGFLLTRIEWKPNYEACSSLFELWKQERSWSFIFTNRHRASNEVYYRIEFWNMRGEWVEEIGNWLRYWYSPRFSLIIQWLGEKGTQYYRPEQGVDIRSCCVAYLLQ